MVVGTGRHARVWARRPGPAAGETTGKECAVDKHTEARTRQETYGTPGVPRQRDRDRKPPTAPAPPPADGTDLEREDTTADSTATAGPERAGTPEATNGTLLRPAERADIAAHLQRAVNGFLDAPRGSVEAADSLLDTLSARLTDLLRERRHDLRTAWHEDDATRPRTEEMRLALLGYRDTVERLLRL